jgi:hypothetical protein
MALSHPATILPGGTSPAFRIPRLASCCPLPAARCPLPAARCPLPEGERMLHIDPARIRPWLGDPPRAAAPEVPGYRLVAHERFNITSGTIAGLVLIPLWAFLIIGGVAALGGRSSYGADFSLGTIALGAFIALVAVPVVHEAVHGFVAVIFRARPSYGIGPGFAYTTFQEPLARSPYLAIGLAPLVVLTLGSIVLAANWDAGAGWVIFFAIVNASGAIGDLWMAWRILNQPRGALFYDLADGFAVLVPDDGTERHA